MDVMFLAGRIIYVLLFINSGIAVHLIQRKSMTAHAKSMGAPLAAILVPLAGVALIAGGLMIAFGVLADLGAILIAAFLILITPVEMRQFADEKDGQIRQIQYTNFMKNLSLLGAALIIFYLYNQLQGDAGFSLTDPLFNKGG